MTPRRSLTVGAIALIATALAAQAPRQAHANSPTIRLFPTTVVEDLRQTGNVATSTVPSSRMRCTRSR